MARIGSGTFVLDGEGLASTLKESLRFDVSIHMYEFALTAPTVLIRASRVACSRDDAKVPELGPHALQLDVLHKLWLEISQLAYAPEGMVTMQPHCTHRDASNRDQILCSLYANAIS